MATKFWESATLKAVIVGLIILLLMVPLMMLLGLVSERASMREAAYARVAEGWGGAIVTGGPVIIVPTERAVIEAGVRRVVSRSYLYILPSRLDLAVDQNLESEPRYVGIYAVPVYLATVQLAGEFEFEKLREVATEPGTTYLWSEARLRLPLSDVRSLRKVGQARFAGGDIRFGPMSGGALYRGVESRLDLSEQLRATKPRFDVNFVVAGSRNFSLLPVGSETSATLKSNWPHPSFDGAFLPSMRSISPGGFDAQWQVLELNRSYGQVWSEDAADHSMLAGSAFGVGLYQAVDVYQRGERATKYALLFIALTFLTFFAWEQVSRARIHPLQYALVGVALSTFYLLLIALSEHMAFAIAYGISAAALVGLIGIYLAGALRSRLRGIVAGAAMTLVYALLYVLVLSEDYALLLGAIILFVALAIVMIATRNVDWYRPKAEAEGA